MTVHAERRSPSRTGAPGDDLVRTRSTYPVSLWLAAMSVVAAGGSLLFPGLLDGAAVTDANLRGTALVVLVVAVPLLGTGMALAASGSLRGLVLWLGAAAYLTYQGVMFSFGTPMNELFLSYVAVLGLGIWTMTLVLTAVEPTGLVRRIGVGTPYRPVGALLATFAVLNALAWLGRILPAALDGDPSAPLDGTGLISSPVFVQDLAVWIPAALVAARLMWTRTPRGVLLSVSLLAFYVVECLSVASDQWWGVRADDSHPELASLSVVPGALGVAAVSAAVLVWSLRHLAADT